VSAFFSFDVNGALNLTRFEGEPLPVAAPLDLFVFRGKDGQSAPMNLTVDESSRHQFVDLPLRPLSWQPDLRLLVAARFHG